MLKVGRYDVITRRQHAADRGVQRLGDVCCKNNVIRARTVEQSGELFPRVLDGACRVKAVAVCAAGGIAERLYGGKDRLTDCGRLFQRGGSVIEIDHFDSSLVIFG